MEVPYSLIKLIVEFVFFSMTSPFSPEQLVFLQQFVSTIVRSIVEEGSRSEHEAESRVEGNAASRPKARPKRKLRAPTEEFIDSSLSPRTKTPKENHDDSNAKPSKLNIQIAPQNLICVCLRCSRLRDLDSRAVIPRVVQAVQPATLQSRFGCIRCGDPEHFIQECPHPHNPYCAPCLRIFVQQERNVDLIRDPHQNPDRAQISANPSLEFKDDQAQGSQGSMNE